MATPQPVTTTSPNNPSEWQLYRVLQRANLLQYYDVFVAQGGDDVQQLCEAGEEEFLEIMALVGMASKPLHVRRLQKALQEWVANPAAFQGPNVTPPAPVSVASLVSSPPLREPPMSYPVASTSPSGMTQVWSPSPHQQAVRSVSPINISPVGSTAALIGQGEPIQVIEKLSHSSSPIPTPVLVESQISLIAKSAARLAKSLPFFEIKSLNTKKDINRQIQAVMLMREDDPNRLEQMRKYAAIYGRFDSRRKNDRPMSLHEISVNEAAAQLCCQIPNLLTRREDLFPLARQIVKDSGYHYSKGHSRAGDVDPQNPSKKQKLDTYLMAALDPTFIRAAKAESDKLQREERLGIISKELAQIASRQEEITLHLDAAKENQDVAELEKQQSLLEQTTNKHLLLLTEQSDLLRKQNEANTVVSHWSSALAQQLTNTQGSNPKPESYGFNLGDYIVDLDKEDSNLASGSSSPTLSESRDGLEAQLRAQLLNSVRGKGMQDTLFDEGLRIAQQYGMADFEHEIKQMKVDPNEKEDSNESAPAINSSGDNNSSDLDTELNTSPEHSSEKQYLNKGKKRKLELKEENSDNIQQEVMSSDSKSNGRQTQMKLRSVTVNGD